MPKVIITMPAYRAERTLEKTVADLPTGVADELILVDDASPDDTVRVARGLGITVYLHSENRGYGGNQKTCYTEALRHGADIVVLLHPDYQYDPKAVPLLIAPILAGDADMTFGSRFAGLGDPRAGGMPLYRFIGNRVTTVVQNLLMGSRFTEMHSGMRAYTRDCLLSLPFRSYSNDFGFDAQLLVDAVTLGRRVIEVPIPTRYTLESSSIAIGASLRYIAEGLSYCARKSVERGRRGARLPVTRPRRRATLLSSAGHAPGPRRCVLCGGTDAVVLAGRAGTQCTRCGLVRAAAPATGGPSRVPPSAVDAILTHLDSYATSGERLVEIAASESGLASRATAAGWKVETIAPGAPEHASSDRADVAVITGTLEASDDPVAVLRAARGAMKPEGLLLALARAHEHGEGRTISFVPQTLAAALDVAGFRPIASLGASAGLDPCFAVVGRPRT